MEGVNECDMWALLGYERKKFINKHPKLPTKQSVEEDEVMVPEEDPLIYCRLLNRLSKLARDGLAQPGANIITFVDSRLKAFRGHPKTTECCPDIIAIAHPVGQTPPSEPWHWSTLEAIGVFKPTDTIESDATRIQGQDVSCPRYLLQARPDLISTLGVIVDVQNFTLSFSNALGVFATEPLQWDAPSSILLLYAWISRLYAPNVDSSIERVNTLETPIFNVTVSVGERRETYKGCSIYKAGEPFGRRTVILKPENSNVIIKEQYVDPMRMFKEGPILEKIHHPKPFPGVVRIQPCDAEPSVSNAPILEHGNYEKEKTRLVMLDKAEPLMDATTVWEALIAFYDLLEVTRFLYTKRKILHRDISEGNILLRDKPPQVPAFGEDLQTMCFASYLLQQDDSIPKVKRLDTSILLVDFDMSEDRDAVAGPDEDGHLTGTPLFMARAVRSGKYLKGTHTFPPMPELAKEVARYRDCVGERLKDFPKNDKMVLGVKKNTHLPRFKHKLRHDAESVFWVLLYWCLLAKPDQDPNPQDIGSGAWSNFNIVEEGVDYRNAIFIGVFSAALCHPAYAPLDGLLEDMVAQLQGDLGLINENPELAEIILPREHKEDPARGKDEYLHEAFQRLILNFLFEHRDAPFMKEKKSKDYRKVRYDGVYRQSLSTHEKEARTDSQTKRKRDDTSYNASGGAPDDTPDEPNEDPDERRPIKRFRL